MKVRPVAGNLRYGLTIVLAFFVSTYRLPAPVEEITSTITPTATPLTKAQPVKTAGKKTNANSRAAPSAPNSSVAPTATAADNQRRPARFAGKWSGTIQTVPWGPWAVSLIVSADETSLTEEINTENPLTTVARRSGEMLQAKFPAGLTTITWSLTPRPDGATAQVRFQAFMNDFTTIFHRADSR